MTKLKKETVFKTTIIIIIFIFLSGLFLFVTSWTTSPLFDYKDTDSGIFQTIGMFANKGLIVYKDLFDHKGPVIFWIQQVGYSIIGNKLGVFVVQIMFWTFSLFGTYKIFNKFISCNKSIIFVVCSLLVYSVYYAHHGGNSTDEFCLPFVIWGIYFSLDLLVNNKKSRSIIASYYGLAISICLFTRFTNALPLCVLVFGMVIHLILKRDFNYLMKNALFFVGGALIVIVPILVWGIVNGTLYDIIDATFIANFKYASQYSPRATTKEKIVSMIRYTPLFGGCILVSTLNIIKKNNRIPFGVIIVESAIASVLVLSNPVFPGYSTVYSPFIILTVCLAFNPEYYKRIYYVAGLLFGIFICAMNISVVKNCIMAYRDNRLSTLRKDIIAVKKEVPRKAYDNVIAYNSSAYFYLESRIKPCCRNFVLQDFHCSFDKKSKKDFYGAIKNGKVKYIVEDVERKNVLDGYINKKYKLVKKTSKLLLFRRK